MTDQQAVKKPLWKRTWFIIVVVVLALMVFGALLGGEDEGNSDDAANPATTGDAPATTGDAPAKDAEEADQQSGCTAPDETTLSLIQGRFVTEAEFLRAGGWKSPDFEDVTFVAQEFTVEGVSEPQTAVFAVGGMQDEDGPSAIMAVDGFAQQFTDYVPAKDTEANISAADDGVDAAKNCLS